jgi:hypothetical protein
VYGRYPPTLLKYQPGSSKVAAVDVQLKERDEFLDQVREHLLLAQDVMKHHHDGKHQALEFDVGEWAWLRLHHRSAVGITPLRPTKLSPRFYGPYRVVERIGEVAYLLHLPAKARIHDVFHVVLLKKFEGMPSEMVPLPPIQHGRAISTPDKIQRSRLNKGTWEVLVFWQGRPATDTTWEKVEDFKVAYPDVQLGDELFLREEGNVVDSFIGKVYQRRPKKKVS